MSYVFGLASSLLVTLIGGWLTEKCIVLLWPLTNLWFVGWKGLFLSVMVFWNFLMVIALVLGLALIIGKSIELCRE